MNPEGWEWVRLRLKPGWVEFRANSDVVNPVGRTPETSVTLGVMTTEMVDSRVLVTVVVPDRIVVSEASNGVGDMPHCDRYLVTVSVTLLVIVTSKRSLPSE